jgi:hypothetical protein
MVMKKTANDYFIFNWSKNRLGWLYLLGFTVFSITIHGVGFYLFKVVYPIPTRIDPTMHSVSILNESNPEVRSLFQRLKDRTIFLKAPSEQSEVRVRLKDHEVKFSPLFETTELKLVAPEYPWSLSLRERTWIQLPESVGKGKLSISLDEKLKSRSMAPWSIFEDYLERADSVPAFRASLKVSKNGDVKVHAIVAELGASDQKELIQVIESTLRFLPGKGESAGWIDICSRG